MQGAMFTWQLPPQDMDGVSLICKGPLPVRRCTTWAGRESAPCFRGFDLRPLSLLGEQPGEEDGPVRLKHTPITPSLTCHRASRTQVQSVP